MFRILRRVLASLLTSWLVWTNIALHTAPPIGDERELQELRRQLSFLEDRVHRGLGADMQMLFPEGSVFTHALYGLAWCGYAQRIQGSDTLRSHALREARWAMSQIEREEVQGRFPVAAEPKFGAFYCGWRNFLLGSILAFGSGTSDEIGRYEVYSAELENAYSRSESPFLESYTNMAWPADNAVAVASLAQHGRFCGTESSVIPDWLERVKLCLDERGMVPHSWDVNQLRTGESARGSSQALMSIFLHGIDSTFAAQQFGLFKENFFMERFGVPLVREYPKGVKGVGDVDSGPVLLGAGFAATIVASGACRVNRDVFHAIEFDSTVEGFGLVTEGKSKRYIFGAMPIADLFIAWGRSMNGKEAQLTKPGFKRFHLWSILAVLLIWSPTCIRLFRRRWLQKN